MKLALFLLLAASCFGQTRLAKWVAVGSCAAGALNVGENVYAEHLGYRELHPLVSGPSHSISIWRLSLTQGAMCAGQIWLSRRKWEVQTGDRPIAVAPVVSLSISGSLGTSLILTSVRDIRGFR